MFIVLEGIEGSGKSTQSKLLGEWLTTKGYTVVLGREPGGTKVGEQIRNIVLGSDMSKYTELFLMLAARAEYVKEVVVPTLTKGHTLISDRYDLSTFAYQGVGRGIGLDAVAAGNQIATAVEPNLYLVLDLPENLAWQRKGKATDRIESESMEFFRNVRQGYQFLVKERDNAVLVDASGSIKDVQERIRGEVRKYLAVNGKEKIDFLKWDFERGA